MFGHQTVSRNPLRSLGSKLLVVGLFISVCVYSLYQSRVSEGIIEEKETAELRCRQKQESLSAQLQVIYEHKSRMEKALKREKDDRLSDKEKCQLDMAEKAAVLEKGTSDCEAKLKDLNEKQQLSEGKQSDLEKTYAQLQQQMNELKDEKLKEQMKHEEELLKSKNDMTQVETQFKNLAAEMVTVRQQNAQLSEKLLQCQSPRAESDLPNKASLLKASNDRQAVADAGGLLLPAAGMNEETKKSPTLAETPAPFGAEFTTTTNQSAMAVNKEDAEGMAQMPLPNDERSIRKSQAQMDETGREAEVAQAEQVAVPKILGRNERASVDSVANMDSTTSSVTGAILTDSTSAAKPLVLPMALDAAVNNNDVNVDQVAPPVVNGRPLEDDKMPKAAGGGELELPEEADNKQDDDNDNHREMDKDGYEMPPN